LTVPLFVVADAFTASARAKIEAAGGVVNVLEMPTQPLAALGLEPVVVEDAAPVAVDAKPAKPAKPAKARKAKAAAAESTDEAPEAEAEAEAVADVAPSESDTETETAGPSDALNA
jgi:hypothetical protein